MSFTVTSLIDYFYEFTSSDQRHFTLHFDIAVTFVTITSQT